MSKQEYKQKQTAKSQETEETDPQPEAVETPVADGIDAILDEIDEVLEENAQEFVAQYIQRADNRGDKKEACYA